MIFFYGIRSKHIKSFPLPDKSCGCCNTRGHLLMSFYGRYAHLFWIPAFPVGMKAFVVCQQCKTQRTEKQFDVDVILTKKEYRKQVRYPIWYFLLLAIIVLLEGKNIVNDVSGGIKDFCNWLVPTQK